MVQDEISFFGHPNVRGAHTTTIEITKDHTLSPRGDCIIGVNASKACKDLKQGLKDLLQQEGFVVKIEIEVDDMIFAIDARSNSRLTLMNEHDIVIRKSNFVCPRTVAISCNRASSDMPRELIHLLRNPQAQGSMRISTE